MAELDVQPKKRSSNSFLPWLLLALGVIALVFFVTRNGDRDDDAREVAAGTTTYSTTSENAARGGWDAVDFENAPRASYDEITGGDVEVSGDDNYAIYSIEEEDLFEDKATAFNKDAEKKLNEVVTSINTRYSKGEVRLYGHSHTQNDKDSEVSTQRMEMVKNWLVQKGISNVSIHPMNATGAAEKNKDDDGRIRIVAMRAK